MSSAKTERLINLTMALLASRRFMTKSEIFRRVAGYSGNQETKERMFERDKDDLRSLGIEIEVGGHDPLFEDEPGYRITPEAYQLPASQFNAHELGLIATALGLWRESEFEDTSHSVSRRFQSIGVTPQEPEGLTLGEVSIDETGLVEIADALADRQGIRFEYRKSGSQDAEMRRVNPMGLSAWKGSWYLVAEDLERGDIRAFKLSRFVSGIERIGKIANYEIPEDFDVRDYLIMFSRGELNAVIDVRKNQGGALRSQAITVEHQDEEWDRLTVQFNDETEFLREILWLTDAAKIVEPESLRIKVVSALTTLEARYV
ncbi:MAG: WYL domain-containing protein [Actinobacteria bacterium]|jgi:proteasome accessory factor B|nr:WYL domain-containing protein [Actinomycetota bacterium]NDB30895.1 WYL domain-containing protein [Actinomycetota bacterium]NDD59763.1 WYL domain-containing protein [Actinomycetota bacterium]NDF42085.1 WYL domain-containing protein [Actinomycetota bacterium]